MLNSSKNPRMIKIKSKISINEKKLAKAETTKTKKKSIYLILKYKSGKIKQKLKKISVLSNPQKNDINHLIFLRIFLEDI
jgi:hypothetical protein